MRIRADPDPNALYANSVLYSVYVNKEMYTVLH